jgi:hypothetical protein
MPGGFEAYVRVLHPARRDPASSTADVRWGELAAARGVELLPVTGFPEVLGLGSDDIELLEVAPSAGSLPSELCTLLLPIFREATSQERCWFCLWDGNGFFAEDARRHHPAREAENELLATLPKVDAYARDHYLCTGPLAAACWFPESIGSSPNLWWPDDRTWIVVTEVDSYSTYVGGTRTLAAGLLESPTIEAIEVDIGVSIDPGY